MKDNKNIDEVVEMRLDDSDIEELFEESIDEVAPIFVSKGCVDVTSIHGGAKICTCCF